MLCRLCLYEAGWDDSVSLFSNGEESNLTKLIAKYLHIEISQKNDFSTKICQKCYQHINDFHNFCQFVEQRQHVQNEFLEVNCILMEETLKEGGDNQNVNDENNEESLLDMKDIIAVGEANLEKLLPQAEFAFADISDGEFHNEDSNDLTEDRDADEDDLPLQELFSKKVPSSGGCSGRKVKTRNTSRKKSKRAKKLTTKAKRNKKFSINADGSNVEDEKNEKRQSSSYTPEENKLRDKMIADHMRLKCEICDFVATEFKELRSHFRLQHNTKAYVTCCGIRFYRRFVLIDHIQVHLNPDHFKCKLCNKVLKSKVCMDIHYANKHADKSGLKHPCTLCNRRFAHVSNLAAHMMSHTDERKYLCEICKKAFKSNYMLKVHVRSMHEERTPYICDTCGKEYKFKPSFERHVAEHQGRPNEPTDQCPVCGKWLMPNGLRRHMDRHDLEDVECKLCGKILKSKSALRGHIEYNHRKQQIYGCPFCDKTFKRPCVLKEHIAMHTGQKDYNCQHCKREFRSKANMYAHIKKIHVEEWAQAQLKRKKVPRLHSEKADGVANCTPD